MRQKMTFEEFVDRANKKHNNKFQYNEYSFYHRDEKGRIIIICPAHGEFAQTPTHHLEGTSCPKCKIQERSQKRQISTDDFKQRGGEVHNYKYDYSMVDMQHREKNGKVPIICKEHGVFWQLPSVHLQGQGCKLCGIVEGHSKQKYSLERFVDKAKGVHGDKYDYSEVKYVNAHTLINIVCPQHGSFSQTPNSHLNGCGCPECGKVQSNLKKTDTLEQFIKKATLKHNCKYSYDKVQYINAQTPVNITCPKHGDFTMTPNNHLKGEGCPKCYKFYSHIEEDLINYIKTFYKGRIISKDREILEGKEIDIFIPEKHIGIEIDGIIWHSEKFETNNNAMLEKTEICEYKGIQLIHIFEDEWRLHEDICKSRIKNILGENQNTIYARKCQIAQVDINTSRLFLNSNHIQGYIPSKYSYGLVYNGELVSLMSFGHLRKNLGQTQQEGKYEMLRFCNKLGMTVVGGASKLLKYFIKTNNPQEIISYADRRWSIGNLYDKLGFTFIHNTPKNYYYVVKNKRENRFKYRKDILVQKYNCPKEKTEHQFCLEQGWYRIYDCGCKKYSLHICE